MKRLLLICFMMIAFIPLLGCAQNKIKLGTIPAPAATSKLRVMVYPISSDTLWHVSHGEYAKLQYNHVSRAFEAKGIYEVVSEADMKAVTGGEWLPYWKLKENDWSIAKQLARALYADYVVITERTSYSRTTYYWKMMLLNAENGKLFSFEESVLGGTQIDYKPVIQKAYRSIFNEAKGDMFANALRKGRISQPGMTQRPALPETASVSEPQTLSQPLPSTASVSGETKIKPLITTKTIPKPAPPVVEPYGKSTESKKFFTPSTPGSKVVVPRQDLHPDLKRVPHRETATTGHPRLVVYDFNASQNLTVVALILTEALREELLLIGQFVLINRENIGQIVDELKLQQSGLVDEQQTVQIGKWLAANESVTGRLDTLGNSYILFAKRTDIKSLITLSMGSLRCTAGKEEEMLTGMSLLAKKLAGLTQK